MKGVIRKRDISGNWDIRGELDRRKRKRGEQKNNKTERGIEKRWIERERVGGKIEKLINIEKERVTKRLKTCLGFSNQGCNDHTF